MKIRRFIYILAVALVTGCGGGSGSGSTAAELPDTQPAADITDTLSWNEDNWDASNWQ